MRVLTEAFERGVSVELRLGGTLIGGWQLSQVVQGVMKGRLGFGVVVFTGEQSASSCQLSIVHSRGAFCRDHHSGGGGGDSVLNEISSSGYKVLHAPGLESAQMYRRSIKLQVGFIF